MSAMDSALLATEAQQKALDAPVAPPPGTAGAPPSKSPKGSGGGDNVAKRGPGGRWI